MSKMMYMDTQYAGLIPASYLVGKIDMYAGTTAPHGWLLCDGTAVSRTTYADLFDVIGTTYGPGDGSTTFNLPNMQGRVPVGSGVDSDTSYLLGNTGGSKDATVPYHRHSVPELTSKGPSDNTSGTPSNNTTANGDKSHSHGMASVYTNTNCGTYVNLGATWWLNQRSGTDNASISHAHGMQNHTHSLKNHTHKVDAHNTDYEGDDVTDANMMPYVVINYIIYAGA